MFCTAVGHLTSSVVADSGGRSKVLRFRCCFGHQRSNDLLLQCSFGPQGGQMTHSSIACSERHHASAKLGRPAPDGISPTPIPVLTFRCGERRNPVPIKGTPMAAIVTARQMRWQDAAPHEPRVQPGTPRQSPRHTSTNRRSSRRCSARRAWHHSGTHR